MPDQPDAKHHRRYIWADLRDIEPPLDATTRVRVIVNATSYRRAPGLNDPSTRPASSFFGGEYIGHDEAGGRGQVQRGAAAAPRCTSISRKRWPALDHPRVCAPTG